jgi:DNA polymerase (family 10)
LSHITYGIGIAKKGWLEAKDVINTLDIESISKFLKDLKQ